METIKPANARQLLCLWDSLLPNERKNFLQFNPGAAPLVDSLSWMYHGTKTADPQDPNNPYKPFPRRPYFEVLHELREREPMLFVYKSRTMMCSWFFAAENCHARWIRQPSKTVFWAQDEDRSVMLIDMCWTLIEQDVILHHHYPLARPRSQQSYNRIEWRDGSEIVGLPGKDPDKIRGEHPSELVVDEAGFIENGGEALDIAIATRVPKITVISSAAPGWFNDLIETAVPEELSLDNATVR